MIGDIQMSNTILDSIQLVTECMDDAQDSSIAVINLLEDLDGYFESSQDYPDIRRMLEEIVEEVDATSEKISGIYTHLDAIASEVSEEG